MPQLQQSKQSASASITIAGLIFGLLFIAAGLLVFFQSSLAYIMTRTMGVTTQGVIERMTESEGYYPPDDGEAKYIVDYSFVLPDGKVVKGHTQLTHDDWHSLTVGQYVSVKYIPSFPRYNCLADYRLWVVAVIGMILFPVVFGGIGSFILLSMLLDISRGNA